MGRLMHGACGAELQGAGRVFLLCMQATEGKQANMVHAYPPYLPFARYEKYDADAKAQKSTSSDAFTAECEELEAEIDKLMAIAAEVAQEGNRAAVAAKNAEIRCGMHAAWLCLPRRRTSLTQLVSLLHTWWRTHMSPPDRGLPADPPPLSSPLHLLTGA
jgi:hypothetical protein